MSPQEMRPDSPVETLEETQDPCWHWRGTLRFWPQVQMRTAALAVSEEESWEAPRNSRGDWPFLSHKSGSLRSPLELERDLLQLKKIQEVLSSRRDEAHFRGGVSRQITPNIWNFQWVLHTLAATQEVPRHTRLHSRGSTKVPPTSREAPFPSPSSRGGILSLRGRERIPAVPIASQEEALSTGKARRTPGSCHHSQTPPDVSFHSREN